MCRYGKVKASGLRSIEKNSRLIDDKNDGVFRIKLLNLKEYIEKLASIFCKQNQGPLKTFEVFQGQYENFSP
jgi:hypothetical protein